MRIHTSRKLQIYLSLALLSLGVLWHVFLADFLLKIPSDFTYTADIASVDNFYDENKDEYQGPQYSVTQFSYQVLSSKEEGLEIKNSFDVRTNEGESIFHTQRIYGIDPMSGAHISELGDKIREGYLFAPRHLKKGEPFTYWHVNYNAPAEMEFVGEETMYGLKVYHYETHYEGYKVDQTENLDNLPGVPESKGVLVEPYLQIWIEPVSAYLVKYEDDTVASYYDLQTGAILQPWNHFKNSYTEQSVQHHVNEAMMKKYVFIVIETGIPAALGLSAVLILLCCSLKKNPLAQKKWGVSPLITIFMVTFPIAGVAGALASIHYNLEEKLQVRFEDRTEEIVDAIDKRIEIYINTLQGTVGLFASSDEVTRTEWATYVAHLDLEKNYPGIGALGYVHVVSEEEKNDFVSKIRTTDFSDFTIYPETNEASHAPVLYLELAQPSNTPSQMIGFDMYTEAIRDAAIVRARDTGEASISGKAEMFNSLEDKKGFLIYIPIYKKEALTDTPIERSMAIQGYTYAPFLVSSLMEGIFEDSHLGISFQIYDGVEINPEALMYEYLAEEPEFAFTKTRTIYLSGHPWTFHFTSGTKFSMSEWQKIALYGSMLGAVLLVALHTFIYYALLISRAKAMESTLGRRRTK